MARGNEEGDSLLLPKPPKGGLSVVEGYPLQTKERTIRSMKYYLAYGSNLSIEQMLLRCPTAVYMGTGEIKDYRLLFRGSKTGNYLTIEKKKGRSVPVVVWKVGETDEAALDLYEGYPRFYRKEEMEIQVKNLIDGTPIGMLLAFVYVMDEKRPLGRPTSRYLGICMEGYERFGFDPQVLMRAVRESQDRKRPL